MDTYQKRGYLNRDFELFHLKDQIETEFDFHTHDFHKITILISGNVEYFIEGKTYQLKPYDIVLVNRNDIHRIQVDNSVPYERIIVYISPAFVDAYQTEDYNLSHCFEQAKKEHSYVLRIPSLKNSSLFKTAKRLEQTFSDQEYAGELYRQVLFLQFMIQLNRATFKERIEYLHTDLYNKKVLDIMQYIQNHLTDDIHIDKLSSEFYLSKYYMMRLFKEQTGMTIGNYLTYRRLLLAREYISSGMGITDACFASGFHNYSTFSRAYKNEFHEPPRNLL